MIVVMLLIVVVNFQNVIFALDGVSDGGAVGFLCDVPPPSNLKRLSLNGE